MGELVGQRESFLRGHQAGYAEALQDIQKEINQIRYNFDSLSLPIIEKLLQKK